MTVRVLILRNDLEKARDRVAQLEAQLRVAELECVHHWGPAVDDPIVTPGHTITDHMSGGFGRDSRNVWIGETRTPRWTRTCSLCGKVETTTAVQAHIVSTPKF